MAVNTECQEAVLLLLEHGADIDAVVSAIGPGEGPRGAERGGANGAGPTGRGLGGREPEWVGWGLKNPRGLRCWTKRLGCGPPAVWAVLGDT